MAEPAVAEPAVAEPLAAEVDETVERFSVEPSAAQMDDPVGPLAVELPTPAVDTVPVIDLSADRRSVAPAAHVEAPVAAAAPIVEVPEAEPVAATQVAGPDPVAVDLAAEPPVEPEPTAAIWQMVAPDAVAPLPTPPPAPVPTGQPAWPPLARQAPIEPQWPTQPAWPAHQQPTNLVSGADAVWAQSSRDLLNRPETGVQACVNCGLPLSARARFCRRCGTNQVASA